MRISSPGYFFCRLLSEIAVLRSSRRHALTISNKNANSAMVMMASMLPRQPQFRCPSGSLSDNRQMIKPMSGVKRTDKKKVHPKPILLLAPNNPTNAARNESVNNPNINSVNPIVKLSVYLDMGLIPLLSLGVSAPSYPTGRGTFF